MGARVELGITLSYFFVWSHFPLSGNASRGDFAALFFLAPQHDDRIGDSAIRLNMNMNYYFCIESIFNYLFSFLLAAITGCIIGFS